LENILLEFNKSFSPYPKNPQRRNYIVFKEVFRCGNVGCCKSGGLKADGGDTPRFRQRFGLSATAKPLEFMACGTTLRRCGF